MFDYLLDQPLRGGCTGRHADALNSSEVGIVDLVLSLYEEAFFTLLFADSKEFDAVRRMTAADDVKDVNHSGECAGRFLTITGRGADRVYDLNFVVSDLLYCLGGIKESFCFNGC